MKHLRWLCLLLVLLEAVTGRAATKDQQPDREMLRMMEFLRQMEMIKQMEILREIHAVEGLADDQVKSTSPSKPPPVRKKEAVK